MLRLFETGDWQSLGHSNRVFCAKYHEKNPNLLYTGGWDSSLIIWDSREKSAVGSIYGPTISGKAIDQKGDLLLTGSYRSSDQLELWDLRTKELVSGIDWDGPGLPCKTSNVYCCQFAHGSEDDTIIAGCTGRNEVKVFEKGLSYKPSWSIDKLKKGVYTLDLDWTNSNLVFGGSGAMAYWFSIKKML